MCLGTPSLAGVANRMVEALGSKIGLASEVQNHSESVTFISWDWRDNVRQGLCRPRFAGSAVAT